MTYCSAQQEHKQLFMRAIVLCALSHPAAIQQILFKLTSRGRCRTINQGIGSMLSNAKFLTRSGEFTRSSHKSYKMHGEREDELLYASTGGAVY